jgi:hypothetical protein
MALPQVESRHNLYFGALGYEGDTICLFMDADGELKRPECIRRTKDGPDEWVKVPWFAF